MTIEEFEHWMICHALACDLFPYHINNRDMIYKLSKIETPEDRDFLTLKYSEYLSIGK